MSSTALSQQYHHSASGIPFNWRNNQCRPNYGYLLIPLSLNVLVYTHEYYNCNK
ncbi:hypothetical protein DAPPUDRAFT_239077 [Daphnia pulex]|uniref:Uncharacterized protein n=1 Tax=Daphnia pulex TaxID=6669 RepID=E9G896_DAPPU|nr:hypothetical protein DAPPUDRAFT_239077 [Daphnia pulex]|eukprot:EFX83939.1 hypothetical protein DAPPUDRAFT_239077 [Daphnia pulex]